MKTRLFHLTAAVCLILAGSAVQAQDAAGTISGIATDSSGARIPNVQVAITNTATAVRAWQGKTNESGAYAAPWLRPGTYDLTFQAEGFKRMDVRGLVLSADRHARVDAHLELGGLVETITVTGESAARLDTESSALTTNVNPSQLEDLPMAGKDVMNLINLSSGVSSGGDPSGVDTSQISINGSRTLNNEFTVNGVSVVGGAIGQALHVPSSDAIREFNISTSAYSADRGRSSGASVSMVIASGTNRFHGGAYEYLRNEVLNANGFFNNLQGQERSANRKNQFGAKLGGPVWVPGLYRGRERTFFFFAYEGLRQKSPSSPISTIPSPAFRSGDFSASPTVVRDPDAGTPFGDNVIPTSRLDSAAVKIANLLPTPNLTGSYDQTNNRYLNNFINPQSQSVENGDYTVRLDHSWTGSTKLFGHLNRFTQTGPATIQIPGVLNPGAGPATKSGWNTAIGVTRIITPTLIAEGQMGFMRWNSNQVPTADGIDVKSVLGIQRSPASAPPILNMTGWTSLGMNTNTLQYLIDNNYQWTGALTWVKGAHIVKTGVQARRDQFNVYAPAASSGLAWSGAYTFNGGMTSATRTAGNAVNTLGDFLLGKVYTAGYQIPQTMVGRRNYNLAFYLQDDWKITRRLTLNLGLRQDYESPMTTANHIYSRVDVNTGKLLVAGRNASESLNLKAPKINLGPRVGFAYSLNGKTVLRSGFGMFFSQSFSNLGGSVLYPGFTATQSYTALGTSVPQAFRLSEGMPLVSRVVDPFQVEANATVSNPLTPSTQFADLGNLPYSMQWNFGIQRELPGRSAIEIDYAGSKGVHLPLNLRYNTVPSFELGEQISASGSGVTVQQYRPFPTVSAIPGVVNVGSSMYHALQVRAIRRASASLSFTAAYTFSKSTDDGSGLYSGSQPTGYSPGQFPQHNRHLDHSVSAFDRPHTVTVTATYTARGPKWVRGINVSPVFSVRDGLPTTITQTSLYPDVIQQRPHAAGTMEQLYEPRMRPSGTGMQYFRPVTDADFPLSPSGPLFVSGKMVLSAAIGTLGRYTARIPGDVNLNLSVNRKFRVTEKVRLQVRADAFNALNQVNFAAPSAALTVSANASKQATFASSSGFGLITSARGARIMQIVMRLEF